MTDHANSAATRESRLIAAPPEKVWAAFMDPAALAEWLPPGTMTGKVHAFDPRAGGGYRMLLFYPADEGDARGKTAAREDRFDVRFVALDPPRRMVEAVTFESDNPDFRDEMTITVTFAPVGSGTQVTFCFESLPPGIRPEDNQEGTRLSLEQLARWLA